MNPLTIATTIVHFLGVLVGLAFTAYMVAGLLGSALYRTDTADRRAEDVRLVITTVASEDVRDALFETVEHTLRNFEEYELYCVLDEGSDLQSELVGMDDVRTVVVPDEYENEAKAKGRAMQYFVETVVADDPDYWYGFLDDDNRILDDRFLREIPHYEDRGYRAMNPVITPRPGRSPLTFMADHIRLVDDLAIYRLFTGVLGRPYLGFHGELLCARGDLLRDVGFDRETIVEDFGFALELAERGVPVWQSRTRVSVLSPHDVPSFFKQRARWFTGVAAYLPRAPLATKLVVGSRIATWSVSVTSSWLLLPAWLFGYGLPLPGWLLAVLLVGSLSYVGTIAIGALRVGGLKGAALLTLVPLYASLEHVVPLYAAWRRDSSFVVIEK